jgi:hypothetical protein
MSGKNALEQAIGEIRTSDAVVLIGAGASYAAGMPLAGQLAPLVWHTLDQHPAVRQRVALLLGSGDGAAKTLIGDDTRAVRLAFREIGVDEVSRDTFQRAFANSDRDRRKHPSDAHDALARLVYAGLALRVVSLNWDTLLEAAFERRYGANINSQGRVLWKAHGDSSNPKGKWMLPSDDGFISEEIVADLESLALERPRVLLIVGYSSRDDTVVRRLVGPLATRWRVFRLSPSAAGEGAIQLTASEALVRIADTLCHSTEVLGWEFVSFDNQRGHFASAHRTLDILNTVDTAGPPGCGTSITAWRLARELNRAGWHVLGPLLRQAMKARPRHGAGTRRKAVGHVHGGR